MHIDKALEILADIITFEHSASHTDKGDAIKLGREALRRVQRIRKDALFNGGVALPGETEEHEKG